jgi:hypothetical protein
LVKLGILNNEYNLLHLRIPVRYILSTSIVALIKLFLAAVLYLSLQLGSVDGYWMDATRVDPLVQNEILIDASSKAVRWVYLFLGWDGAWYASIAAKGYSFTDQSFAFMPGLPFLARLLQTIIGGILPALVVISLIFGLIWVPLFQSIAEHYSGKQVAFISSILFALSPFTLLFTTIAYAEGFFLFTTLAAWRLYLGKKYLAASMVAALVTLVRVPGFLIVLPMVIDLLGSRTDRSRLKSVLIGIPTMLALLCWVAFMGFNGDPLAILHTTEWSGMYTLPTYFGFVLPAGGFNALSFPVAYLNIHWLTSLAIWGSILLLPFLLWRLWLTNHSLGIYCLAYLAGVFAFGAAVSTPRFLVVLFPLWFPISETVTSRRWACVPLIVGSVIVCGILWASFLGGVFVG